MANISQATGKALREITEAALKKTKSAKPVWTSGEESTGLLGQKLGAAIGEKAIQSDLDAGQKAAAATAALKEQGIRTFKDTPINLKKDALENPDMSVEDLVKLERERVGLPKTKTKEQFPKPSYLETETKAKPPVSQPLPETEIIDTKQSPFAPVGPGPKPALTKTQKVGAGMAGLGGVGSISDAVQKAKQPEVEVDEGPTDAVVSQAPRIGVASPGYLGLPPEVPTPEDKLKQKPAVKPVSVRVKGQTSNKPLTETTVENAARQAKAGLNAASTIDELKKKIAEGNPITRGDLVTVFQAMEAVKPDKVETDKELTNQILAAKNEAKKAYREQADINQWSEVAQTIGNAIANFVAAQRGVADRALALPNVDYNARTMNALREYQTELSSLGEESRALERKTERETLAAERAADDKRRTMERLYLMGEKQIEAAERQAEKEQDRALQWRISQAKYDKSIADAVTKRDKDADKAAAQQGKLRASLLTKSIKDTDDLIAGLQKQIAAGTAVVNTEDKNAWDKAFNEYASATGVTKEEARFKKEPVIFKWTDPTFDRATARKEVSLHIQQLKQQVAQETQKRNKLTQDREAAILGVAPQVPQAPAPTQAPAQAAPTPPSTGPEKPDTVVLRDPKSGKTARVPWDGAAQAKVQSGQLELVK